jgi:hypothetical protein
MSLQATATPASATQLDDSAATATAAALQAIDERTRAIAQVVDELRPLLALAQQAPAAVAVAIDSFDEIMRSAQAAGIDVERGVLNGAEAALRFGAVIDAEKVRELDALLRSACSRRAPCR